MHCVNGRSLLTNNMEYAYFFCFAATLVDILLLEYLINWSTCVLIFFHISFLTGETCSMTVYFPKDLLIYLRGSVTQREGDRERSPLSAGLLSKRPKQPELSQSKAESNYSLLQVEYSNSVISDQDLSTL